LAQIEVSKIDPTDILVRHKVVHPAEGPGPSDKPRPVARLKPRGGQQARHQGEDSEQGGDQRPAGKSVVVGPGHDDNLISEKVSFH
jgi:hypothetical protein